jgi:hypothetical protein
MDALSYLILGLIGVLFFICALGIGLLVYSDWLLKDTDDPDSVRPREWDDVA